MRSPASPPRLGEAAQDHQPGDVRPPGQRLPLARHRVQERLVHDQRPPGTGEPGDRVRRVQHRRRVGRVADHHEVGVLRDGRRVQPEPVRLPQQHPVDRVPRVPQRRLRLRELGVHHDRPAHLQRPRQQHERLRRACRQQHPLHRQPVPRRHRRPRRPPVRVGGEGAERGGNVLAQPGRRRVRADVHREVHQRRAVVAHLGVPVVPQVRATGPRRCSGPGLSVRGSVRVHARDGARGGGGRRRRGGSAAAAAVPPCPRNRAARSGTHRSRSSSADRP